MGVRDVDLDWTRKVAVIPLTCTSVAGILFELTSTEVAKLGRSMSRKGCSPDNAACEGFFGRLKIEMFFSRNWLSTTIKEFVAALDAYIRWYNETRIKISLGFRSPTEHRRSLAIAV
jgi:transposase InsO family protein